MLIQFIGLSKSLASRCLFNNIIGKYSFTVNSYAAGQNLISKQRFQKFIQPRLSTIDPQSSQIIVTISKKMKFDKALTAMMDKYLNILQKNHTPKGLLTILITLKQIKQPIIQLYCRRIVQFIIRSNDISLYTCDNYTFRILITQLQTRLNQSQEKLKVSMIKYFIIQLIITNIQQINHKNIATILKLLNNLDDRGSVSQYIRFLKLSNLLQEKLNSIFKSELQLKFYNDQNSIRVPFFITHALNFYFSFPPQKNEYTQIFCFWLKKRLFEANTPIQSFALCNCYKSFPYNGKNQTGKYYKDLVLDSLLKKRKSAQVHSYEDWNQSILCYAILSFQFYKIMNQVQFHYEGELNYLLKEDVFVPSLPAEFWSFYQKVPSLINNNGIMYHIIKQIYPQKYVKSSAKLTHTIKPPMTQNQMKVRLALVCQKLGLNTQRQIQISGRYVDFLIDGNIVIECDGDHHFNMHSMDYDESTQFRNLHILLSGHKLILINIFQYNKNRDLQSLAKLLSKKIECLQRTNAILVI